MTDSRRAAAFAQAEAGLRTEWKYWREQTATAVLEKHTTQIDSIVGLLGAGLDDLRKNAGADRYERVLDLYHVWDFFRSKLVLRSVPPLRSFLDAADEFAWTLYRPAAEAAGRRGEQLREPPLVFLDRGTVPFAATRGSSYRDLLPRGVRTGAGALAAAVLPFPVIGVPWYLSAYLPGVLLVAHEVGHHIEDDAELTAELAGQPAVAGLTGDRVAVWEPWLGEVFADVVASVACGTAYGQVLADALAEAPQGGIGADRYPPAEIRTVLCAAAVDAATQGLDVDPARAGDTPASEAVAIAHAIVRHPWAGLGGSRLAQIVRPEEAHKADDAASALLAGLESGLSDVRAVLPAAALAFHRDPAGYADRHVADRAVDEVLDLRPQGPRGIQPENRDSRAARDELAAAALLRLLARPAAVP